MNETNGSELFLGLGKTIFNSSASVISSQKDDLGEIFLTERINQKKASGAWPETALQEIEDNYGSDFYGICENRDVYSPQYFENNLNKTIPFYTYLFKKGLEKYCSNFNPDVSYISHHLCHAYSALAFSPFDKSLILVIDGAGTNRSDFSIGIHDHNYEDQNPKGQLESYSVYLQDGPNLTCLYKNFQTFENTGIEGHDFSMGLGSCYEKIAEYIFNNKRASGKVMGLAAFGSPSEMDSPIKFLSNLDWKKQYQGKEKIDWERSKNINLYKDIAATTQSYFEKSMENLISLLKMRNPDINNLIITGGTALNCTSNFKLLKKNIFSNIFIPPSPGDECISYGLAYYQKIKFGPGLWSPKPVESQHGFLGPKKNSPNGVGLNLLHEKFETIKPDSIIKFTAQALSKGKVIAWFQGRSESGPRALGNRSILASPTKKKLKDYLNSKIKFRESFRPYGCSCLKEYATEYFKVDDNFHNPYMSFATPIRESYQDILKEVSHIDGTSRMQTVTKEFNPKYYELIQEFGDLTDLYCLLNTSLNIMGKPIVESAEDLLNFGELTEIDAIVYGDYYFVLK